MKTILKTMCVSLLLAPLALAAPGEKKGRAESRNADRPTGARLAEQLEKATADLNLSNEQQTQVQAITSELPTKVRELVEQTQDMSPRDRAERVRELLAETRTSIEAVLNDDQKQQLAEKIEAAKATREARRAERRAQDGSTTQPGATQGGQAIIQRLETALSKLELTDAQKAEAQTIVADLKAQIDDLRSGAAGDAGAVREGAREALENARKQIAQLLDDEQKQQLRQSLRGAAKKSE
jgi:hypothetical protein